MDKSVQIKAVQKFRRKSIVLAIQLENTTRSIADVLIFLDIVSNFSTLILEINNVKKYGYITVDLVGKEHTDIIRFGDWVIQDENGYFDIYSDEDFKEEFEKEE